MRSPIQCPSCHAIHHFSNAAGDTLLLCERCGDVFPAGAVEVSRVTSENAPKAEIVATLDPAERLRPEPDEPGVAQTRAVTTVLAVSVAVVALLLAGIGVGIWFIVDQTVALVRKNNTDREAPPVADQPTTVKPVPVPKVNHPPVVPPVPPKINFPPGKGERPEMTPPQPPGPGNGGFWTGPPGGLTGPGGIAPPQGLQPPPQLDPALHPPIIPPGTGPGGRPTRPFAKAPVEAVEKPVPLPEFKEPANPYKAGTQTKLRELGSVPLPDVPKPAKVDRQPFRAVLPDHVQLAHSPKHQLLFVRNPTGVWVYDLKTGKAIGTQTAKQSFTDMSMAPDESALFVADYGGENMGYGTYRCHY